MTSNYTKDELDNAYIAGQHSDKMHDRMSDENKQQFIKMGEEITQLKVTSTRIETKVDNIIDTLKAHIAEEGEYRKIQDAFHKDIVEKKADKVVVDEIKANLSRATWIVLTLVITAIIGSVLITYKPI